ncbi:unnamed protein product [Effrenium voratum]|uniref:Uncharacterized protein n=1 Tax=Effrenium voratum TaxID=2562239 RepID=A0AA36N5Q7_9DINO|nr:unnamed protein product [Effrenium voratum]
MGFHEADGSFLPPEELVPVYHGGPLWPELTGDMLPLDRFEKRIATAEAVRRSPSELRFDDLIGKNRPHVWEEAGRAFSAAKACGAKACGAYAHCAHRAGNEAACGTACNKCCARRTFATQADALTPEPVCHTPVLGLLGSQSLLKRRRVQFAAGAASSHEDRRAGRFGAYIGWRKSWVQVAANMSAAQERRGYGRMLFRAVEELLLREGELMSWRSIRSLCRFTTAARYDRSLRATCCLWTGSRSGSPKVKAERAPKPLPPRRQQPPKACKRMREELPKSPQPKVKAERVLPPRRQQPPRACKAVREEPSAPPKRAAPKRAAPTPTAPTERATKQRVAPPATSAVPVAPSPPKRPHARAAARAPAPALPAPFQTTPVTPPSLPKRKADALTPEPVCHTPVLGLLGSQSLLKRRRVQ